MTTPSSSQAHLAYLALETSIVTLKLKPGSLVTEKQLIDLAGHGRTPVREASQKLEWQGLIAVRPRVGLQITLIKPEDHANVMLVRHKLEPLAASLVAEHADAEARAAMIECAQTMTACSINADMEGFLAADKAFDDIMEAAGDLAAAHGLQLWDAVICTAAEHSGARAILTEDLQDGRLLQGMRIINPFNPANDAAIDALFI